MSTRVVLHVREDNIFELLTLRRHRQSDLRISLQELVAHLCPCLDCDVLTCEPSGAITLAHSGKWFEISPLDWLKQIEISGSRAEEKLNEYLSLIAPFLRVIFGPDGYPCGRAAIAFGQFETGLGSIGGLISGRYSRAIGNFSTSYVGGIEFEPTGPSRGDSGAPLYPDQVKDWATEQAHLIAESRLDSFEKYLVAMNIAEFGGDPSLVATILINRKATSLLEVFDSLNSGASIFAVLSNPMDGGLAISMLQHGIGAHFRYALAWNEVDFSVLTMESWAGRRPPEREYHAVPTHDRPATSSFLHCLASHALTHGRNLDSEVISDMPFATYIGETSSRDKLITGAELRGGALKLSLR
jgi:hypothetical protein